MHDLSPITALGGSAARVETVGAVTLTERPDVALASVAARRGQAEACATALTRLLGAAAPAPGKSSAGDPFSAVWMGPGQWMLSADFTTHEDIAAMLKDALADMASITEQTDAWTCFDLTGQGAFAVLELLCNVNLTTFHAGNATRSTIHHLGCFVICTEPDTSVRIIGPRASAGSLHHAITTAMAAAL
ncbi:sarcosine oxidase subunit gamma [Poseidonocella sedimentorum]|uniref:Sarcosine oxidase subunit gamma n=1 Tax=Poseidonocella sedimentorum TaxID=871652 RepID=A0A1I6DKY9_9RHOB|nr:sarcosine oxidase subunit gamma [Poseidonocella sedimentorum]SFR06012.1 sarcosine oxidase subunit gamma [Poseidonocella sedimentorum]